MKIVLLNTTIVTTDGDYSIKTISLEKAKELVKNANLLSAIGHQSTADIVSELLEIPIKMNRIMYTQEVGDIALCFKLKGRPEEVQIYIIHKLYSYIIKSFTSK